VKICWLIPSRSSENALIRSAPWQSLNLRPTGAQKAYPWDEALAWYDTAHDATHDMLSHYAHWAGNVVCEWTDDQTFYAANCVIAIEPTKQAFEVVRLWAGTALHPGSLPGPAHADSMKRLSQALHQTLRQEPVLDGFDHPGEPILQQMFNDYAAESSKWVNTLLAESDETSRKADILKLLCRFKPQTLNWRRNIVTIALQSPSCSFIGRACALKCEDSTPRSSSARRRTG
jgi:hypothetical protein